jgi:hypothetical protein
MGGGGMASESCVAPGQCQGLSLACSSAATCPGGDVCCAMLGGGGPPSAQCSPSCGGGPGAVQICATSAECKMGMQCRTTPIGIKFCR